MYQETYQLCRNTEAVMGLFSEELRELDRNTVQLMIDEMQTELERLKEERKEVKAEIQQYQEQLQEQTQQYPEAHRRIAELEQKCL